MKEPVKLRDWVAAQPGEIAPEDFFRTIGPLAAKRWQTILRKAEKYKMDIDVHVDKTDNTFKMDITKDGRRVYFMFDRSISNRTWERGYSTSLMDASTSMGK